METLEQMLINERAKMAICIEKMKQQAKDYDDNKQVIKPVVTKIENVEQLKDILKEVKKTKDYDIIQKKTPIKKKVFVNDKVYAKKYREAHKNETKKYNLQYQKKLIKCVCGAEINYGSRFFHLKTKKHLDKVVFNKTVIDEKDTEEK